MAGGGPRRLSTAWIFFLVVSAASPLTSLVGSTSLAFVQGNGAGLPAAFAGVTLLLLCFAVGYAAISRRVINTGAFYTYVARGIGRPPAIGAGLLAIVAYTVNVAAIAGSSGYFTKIIAAELGFDIGWAWGSAVALAVVGFLGYRSLHLGAKVLGTVVVVSVVVLLTFDILVIARKGLAAALPLDSFAPDTVLSGSPFMAAIFAITCFVGIETAALYSEESSDPERSVPRAIYIAVAGLGLFYVLSTWILVGSIGADRVEAVAAEKLGNLVFDEMLAYGGDGLQTAVAVLFLLASFAGMLGFHNAASRYLFVLGRDRVLPTKLGQLHPRHHSPRYGSLTVTAAATVIVLVCAIFRVDPFVVLTQGATGLATLGIISLQTLAAVAIVAFFRRRGQGRYWKTLILPSLGAVGLFSLTVFLLFNFGTVFTDSPVAIALPWLLVAIGLGGLVYGLVLRNRKPARYARLAESRLRPQARQLARPSRWTRRYLLIGAGPAGLAMARRLNEERVPFDWYERHNDVGGIWHADRMGGPTYNSVVAISSRYTSAFPDLPMPEEYPDYPAWWQVRDYLRHYAAVHGLYDLVTLNTAVTWVQPDGVGWTATMTTGDFRYYSGVIAAPGTAWHPVMPTWPGQERFRGQIWHSARYQDPAELAGKRVLVVGAGNSGAEIACDAARSGAVAYLSMRRGHQLVPRHIDGVPTDAVLAGVLPHPRELTGAPDPTELVEQLTGDLRRLGLLQPNTRRLPGHPTMSDELLAFIEQGWVHVRPDIAELLPGGVRFTDGTAVEVDLIIAATGFERQLPFLAPEVYCGSDGRPDLYLNMFSRTHDGLVILGLSDFAGATFPRFDDMARAVIVDVTLRELGDLDWRAWKATKQEDRQDLRGGLAFVDTPRTEMIVDDHAYQVRLRDLCDQFGYAPMPYRGLPRPIVATATR
jgi:cation diffusion facilitator CzcD-associated flavoprotein CzcO/amino acid transporter